MHASPGDTATMVAPIEIDTVVPCTPDAAFEYFTGDIAKWWPLARYSCSQDRATSVRFEGGVGGRLVETDRDGNTYVWGTVSTWEPGGRIALTWHPGAPPETAMTVTITFAAAGASTRVKLVHSGFERLGDRAAGTRGQYAGGWPTVIGELYRGHCAGAP